MTADHVTGQVILFMAILYVLWALTQAWRAASRCWYCGHVGSHDDDCPRGRV